MARIRTIKPEFWTDENMSMISETARLMAIGLLNFSDDEGWFNANPLLVESFIFPFRNCSATVPNCIKNLVEIGYIKIYTGTDGKNYGNIVNFRKHQRISKPQKSKIVDLIEENSSVRNRSATVPQLVDSGKEQGTGNRERKGKEKEKDYAIATSLSIPGIDTAAEANDSLEKQQPDEPTPSPARSTACPYQKIIDLYHDNLPMCPKVVAISNQRKRAISARWKNGMSTLEDWSRYFSHVAESKFMTGRVDPSPGRKQFIADIDFLMRESTIIKTQEGKYHSNGRSG